MLPATKVLVYSGVCAAAIVLAQPRTSPALGSLQNGLASVGLGAEGVVSPSAPCTSANERVARLKQQIVFQLAPRTI